jgi:hypothetical protein
MGTFCQRCRGVTVLDIYYVQFMNRLFIHINLWQSPQIGVAQWELAADLSLRITEACI